MPFYRANCKDLYDYAKALHVDEIDRGRRLEEKANRLATVIGILIAITTFVIKELALPLLQSPGLLEWTVILVFVVILLILIICLFFLSCTYKCSTYSKEGITKNDIEYFTSNELSIAYYGLTQRLQDALKHNTSVNNKKMRHFTRAIYIFYGLLVFLVGATFLTCHVYNGKKYNNDVGTNEIHHHYAVTINF